MKKPFKKFLNLAFLATIGYFGYKIYGKIKGVIELDKTLPQYLENIVGEKPKISINTTLNKITLNIAFSKEILDKNKDLEDTIRDYIGDFYPMIKLEKLEIVLKEKEPEEPAKE
ncbi:MAG: hypothetical protein KAU01_01995 [Candidatus Cloacimonetes bacterium]|nr:hypothetical protein [Candidatus Cloacimonadota bacterium]